MQAGKFEHEQNGINKINDLIEQARKEIFTPVTTYGNPSDCLGAGIWKFLNTLAYIPAKTNAYRVFLTYNGEPYDLNVNKDDFTGFYTDFRGSPPSKEDLWAYMYSDTLDDIWKI